MIANPMEDLRPVVRALRRSPGFAVTAILVLSLALGANTALFDTLYRALARPLPYPAAGRLMLVWETVPRSEWPELPLSFPNYTDLRDQNGVFEDLAAWHGSGELSFTLTGAVVPRSVPYAMASANLFGLLGAVPALGRTFVPEEDRPGGPRVLVVSHRFWSEALGADPAAVGRTLTLDGEPYQVVGVLPASFRFVNHPAEPDVWIPLALDPGGRGRMFARPVKYLGVVGRLGPGVTPGQAATEVVQIGQRLSQSYPVPNPGWGFSIEPLAEHVSGLLRPSLLLLQGAMLLVLLVACANLASLLAARGNARRHELAVRSALGASRGRLARQLLLEAAVLGFAGAAGGLVLAVWGRDLIRAVAPGGGGPLAFLDPLGQVEPLGGVTLLFGGGLALLASLAAGVVPALRLSRPGVGAALRSGSAVTGRRDAGTFRAALVVAEVAISLILLLGAGLLLRSLDRLRQVDPGFRAEGVLTAELALRRGKYDSGDRMTGLASDLVTRLAALPGVTAAGVVEQLPLSGRDQATDIRLEGEAPSSFESSRAVHYRSAGPGYFEAMGVRLLRGRLIQLQDGPQASAVAVVNQTMARRLWPGQDPIGRRVALSVEALVFDRDGPPRLDFARAFRTVVGVVEDVHHNSLTGAAPPEMWVPYAQRPTRNLAIVLRTAGDPAILAGAIREAVTAVDPDQPVGLISTMSDRVGASLAPPRTQAGLVGFFALTALLLAVVGLYGVLATLVAERQREIGLRLALGATSARVLRLVLREGGRLISIGVLLGLLGGLVAGRLLARLLYGVNSTDPVTFLLVPLVLALAALAACWIPARRAARVDPMTALRAE